jgi:integrase
MFLSVEEIGRLVGFLPARHKAIVLTAAFTGLRWGELSALRISDLRLLRRRLTGNQTAARAGGHSSFGLPKTAASRRIVSLPPDLAEVLAEHLRRFPVDGGSVFTGEKGAVLRSTNFRRRVWLPAVKAAGLDGLRFHDLRHSHAALLISGGEHVDVIQSRLGHASAKITLDTYGHLLEGLG